MNTTMIKRIRLLDSISHFDEDVASASFKALRLSCSRWIVAVGVAVAMSFALDASNPYVVNVESGTLKTLTADDVSSMAGYDELVKTGDGTLVAGSVMSGFTGIIRVQAGVYEVTESGALGTTVGATYVSSGASLRLNGATSGCIALGDEEVHITGTGNEESPGAMRNIGKQQLSAFKKILLDGDATMTMASNASRFDLRDGTLSMGGHTLTWAGENVNLSFSLTRANLTGGGNIVVESGILQIEGSNSTYTWEGGANNTLTVKNGACLQRSDNSRSSIPWTLKLEKGAKVRAISAGRDDDSRDDWAGPVVINGKKNENSVTGGYTSDSILRFSGPVSGVGNFYWTGGWVSLYNPTNSFAGTWLCNRDVTPIGGLVLNNTGAVTTVAQGIDMRGGAVLKLNGDAPYNLPPLKFSGTRDLSVTGGCGTAVSLTKTGIGTLSFGGRVAVTGVTEIAGGTLKVAGRVPYGHAGLWQGAHLCSGEGSDTAGTVWWGRTLYKDNTTNSIFYADQDSSSGSRINHGNSKGCCVTFSGYIWNRTDEAVTWTISAYMQTGVFVYLNNTKTSGSSSECVIQQFGSNGRKFANMTLNPGANLFEVRLYRSDTWYPHSGDAAGDWPSKTGLMYAIGADRTDPSDFMKFEDPGDGSLFTCDLVPRSELYTLDYRASFDNLKLSGGKLDLDDREIVFAADTLSGYGEISNGVFRLTEKWIITADAVANGGVMFRDADLAFGENAVFMVDDVSRASVPETGVLVGTVTGGSIAGLSKMETGDGRWVVCAAGNEIRLYRRRRGTVMTFR